MAQQKHKQTAEKAQKGSQVGKLTSSIGVYLKKMKMKCIDKSSNYEEYEECFNKKAAQFKKDVIDPSRDELMAVAIKTEQCSKMKQGNQKCLIESVLSLKEIVARHKQKVENYEP